MPALPGKSLVEVHSEDTAPWPYGATVTFETTGREPEPPETLVLARAADRNGLLRTPTRTSEGAKTDIRKRRSLLEYNSPRIQWSFPLVATGRPLHHVRDSTAVRGRGRVRGGSRCRRPARPDRVLEVRGQRAARSALPRPDLRQSAAGPSRAGEACAPADAGRQLRDRADGHAPRRRPLLPRLRHRRGAQGPRLDAGTRRGRRGRIGATTAIARAGATPSPSWSRA